MTTCTVANSPMPTTLLPSHQLLQWVPQNKNPPEKFQFSEHPYIPLHMEVMRPTTLLRGPLGLSGSSFCRHVPSARGRALRATVIQKQRKHPKKGIVGPEYLTSLTQFASHRQRPPRTTPSAASSNPLRKTLSQSYSSY
jgi:hypothetical protein